MSRSLIWDPERISSVLGCAPTFEDNSSYIFRFTTLGGEAQLTVLPYNGEVSLRIGEPPRDWLSWRLDCAEIRFNDEVDEEGGTSLVFIPKHSELPSSHWMIIYRENGDIQIDTFFRANGQRQVTRA
jgi:hypothetical protein